MQVAFRVDSSVQMGTGHVMRCLTLADVLAAEGAQCTFISRETTGNLHRQIRERGFGLAALGNGDACSSHSAEDPPHAHWLGVGWQDDAAESLEALAKLGPVDWLVVDHYALDRRWSERLRQAAKRILVVDDLADRALDCDLLLDQNLDPDGAERYRNLTPSSCRMLMGPSYALLKPAFASLRARGATSDEPSSALVFLGGSDPDGVTLRALQALERVRPQELTADVVIGVANPFAAHIRAWAESRRWVRLHENVSDMAALMAKADLAIGAGGTTTWERACLGLPTVMIVIAENQRRLTEHVALAGAAVHAGDWETADVDSIAAALRDLIGDPRRRAAMRRAAMELVDGQGAARVAREMQPT